MLFIFIFCSLILTYLSNISSNLKDKTKSESECFNKNSVCTLDDQRLCIWIISMYEGTLQVGFLVFFAAHINEFKKLFIFVNFDQP